MKSILQPIKPQYCELIVAGKKTIEVRKTRPKIETPFKCYIYETKAQYIKSRNGACTKYGYGCGKVIGEFFCDAILSRCESANADIAEQQGCVKREELFEYSGGKDLYGWHISDLKIYDRPKELSEFGKKCNLDCPSVRCPYWKNQRVNADEWDYDCSCNNIKPLTRPPQSWCYVEEV